MSRLHRRSFLQTALVGATVTIAGTKSSGRVLGANDNIRLAVCGLNGRGGDHVKEFSKIPGVQITHLVDPDTRVFEKRQKQLSELKCPKARTVQDVRKVLENKDVDAISIATPNHWHALMTIWACQAGKDVYVEKPCSHNVHEGRVAVETARKTGRVVQHGTQRRGWKSYQNLAAVVKSGHYGPLRVSHGIVFKPRLSIGNKPVTEVPSELDFDLWTGPAKKTAFHTNLVHYNWHWFWDFGNGDIGNQGVHQMDIARWMIPGATLPKTAFSLGGRFGYQDQGETPNTQLTLFNYGGTLLLFEVRGLVLPKDAYPNDTKNEGSVLHFDGGHIVDFKFYPKGGDKGEPIPKLELTQEKLPGNGSTFANFIACVRSRKTNELYADILEGHYSSALCHLGNVSYRLGSEATFSPKPQLPTANKDAAKVYEQIEEHLVAKAGIKPAESKLRVGKLLNIDVGTEHITNDAAANTYLTRAYRVPFVVPERAEAATGVLSRVDKP